MFVVPSVPQALMVTIPFVSTTTEYPVVADVKVEVGSTGMDFKYFVSGVVKFAQAVVVTVHPPVAMAHPEAAVPS